MISSKTVIPAMASRKTAAVLIRIGFQGHRGAGRPAWSISADVATGSVEGGAAAAIGGVTAGQPSTVMLSLDVDVDVIWTGVFPTRPTNAEAILVLVCFSEAV